MYKTTKHKIVINNNDLEIRIDEKELDKYLKDGWQKGFSKEHRNKISKVLKGRESSTKGKHLKEETRKKISNSLKGNTPHNKGKFKYQDLSSNLQKNIIDYYLKGHSINKCVQKFKISKSIIYSLLVETNNIRNLSEAYKCSIRPTDIGEKISKSKMGHSVSQKTRDAVSYRNKHRTKEQIKIQLTKSFITKKLNNTFNTSQPEEDLYKTLLKENVNKTIYRQYKDDRYPFYCDFYIVEDDLFIELNAHWTHGGHPFDINNEDDIKKLDEWKEKAKTSKFYENAIQIWTKRDVEKQRIAKENKINYKVIY